MICPLCDKSTKIGLTNILRYGEERSVFIVEIAVWGFLKIWNLRKCLNNFMLMSIEKI